MFPRLDRLWPRRRVHATYTPNIMRKTLGENLYTIPALFFIFPPLQEKSHNPWLCTMYYQPTNQRNPLQPTEPQLPTPPLTDPKWTDDFTPFLLLVNSAPLQIDTQTGLLDVSNFIYHGNSVISRLETSFCCILWFKTLTFTDRMLIYFLFN